MFKNCVFNVSVDTKKWLKAAGVRAVKTMAQSFIAMIGTAAVMQDVNDACRFCDDSFRYFIDSNIYRRNSGGVK